MRQLYYSSITESLKISSFSWYYHHFLEFSYFFVDDAYKTCGVQNVHTQTISSNFQESLIVLLEWLLAEQITLEYNNRRKEKNSRSCLCSKDTDLLILHPVETIMDDWECQAWQNFLPYNVPILLTRLPASHSNYSEGQKWLHHFTVNWYIFKTKKIL